MLSILFMFQYFCKTNKFANTSVLRDHPCMKSLFRYHLIAFQVIRCSVFSGSCPATLPTTGRRGTPCYVETLEHWVVQLSVLSISTPRKCRYCTASFPFRSLFWYAGFLLKLVIDNEMRYWIKITSKCLSKIHDRIWFCHFASKQQYNTENKVNVSMIERLTLLHCVLELKSGAGQILYSLKTVRHCFKILASSFVVLTLAERWAL